MAHAATARLSFAELYRQIAALPPGLTGEILEPGVLRTMSRPGKPHRLAAKRAARDLESFDVDVGGSGWWIEHEVEILLLDDYLAVPDLAGWRIERVPELPEENPITIVPDWACEILSPSTARDDRRLKLPLYARAGIEWIWLLDAEARQVEIYETVAGRATFVLAAADRATLPPFDRPFDVATWFAPPTPHRKTARERKAKKASKRGTTRAR